MCISARYGVDGTWLFLKSWGEAAGCMSAEEHGEYVPDEVEVEIVAAELPA